MKYIESISTMSPTNEATEFNLSEEEDDITSKKEKKGWSRLYIGVEPIAFIAGFTIAFTSGVTIDLVQSNVCHRHYGLSFDECTSLNVSKDVKAKTEEETAQINMIINFIQGIVPVFLIFFIGPWSDKYGRKPFLLFSVRGYVLYYLLWTLISFFPYISEIYLYIPSILLSSTGTFIVIFISMCSYTCDNFGAEDITFRYSVVSAATNLGKLAGNGLAERVFVLGGDYGFQAIFGLSFTLSFATLLYTTFVLEETVNVKKGENEKLFNLSHVKSLYEAIFNPVKGRLYLLLLLTVLLTDVPRYEGEGSIYYLAGKSLFNWSLGRYNLFEVLTSLSEGVVSTLIVWCLIDKLGIANSTVLVLSSTSLAILQLSRVFSVNEEMFWILSILLKATHMLGPTMDTELTECISKENAGKAFTLTALVDCWTLLISAPLYAQVYTLVLPDKTMYLFLLSFALALITMLSTIWLYFYTKKKQYILSRAEPPSEDQNEPDEVSSLKT